MLLFPLLYLDFFQKYNRTGLHWVYTGSVDENYAPGAGCGCAVWNVVVASAIYKSCNPIENASREHLFINIKRFILTLVRNTFKCRAIWNMRLFKKFELYAISRAAFQGETKKNGKQLLLLLIATALIVNKMCQQL